MLKLLIPNRPPNSLTPLAFGFRLLCPYAKEVAAMGMLQEPKYKLLQYLG